MKNQIKNFLDKNMKDKWNLDEIVFENKNKTLGACPLRKSYDRVLSSIILSQILFFIGLYLSYKFLNTNEINSNIDVLNTGQVMTPEMVVVTVDLQEPPKQIEPKKTVEKQTISGPPLDNNQFTQENKTIESNVEENISSIEFEPPSINEEIEPKLEEVKQELVTEENTNIDFFETETSKPITKETTNLNKQVIVLKTKEEQELFNKIKRRVKKVYPYVILAQVKLNELNIKITSISKNKDKKQLTEKYENELRQEFGNEISKLSMEEGKILMKLLDRNTGETAYDIMAQFRGKFQAVIAQGIAKLFGQNLKSKYNKTEDAMIETAVSMVEQGSL